MAKKTKSEEILDNVAKEDNRKKMSFEEKMKKLQDAIAGKYGRGKVVRGEEIAKQTLERLPIYSPIDKILGGGIPLGRVIEILGKPSVGKTSLCSIIAKKFQEDGKKVAYIEVDNSLDLESMRRFGVNTDELYIVRPESCEEALDNLDAFIRTREFGCVILDCVAMLSPEDEVEGSMQDNQMALLARQLNKVLRKVHSGLQAEDLRDANTYNDVSIVLINQLRTKLGVLYGSPETSPGGLAREYSASIRVKVSRVEDLKNSAGEVIGVKSKLETIKNKTYYPKKECVVSISHWHGGFYETEDLLKQLLEEEVIIKAKGWIKFKDPNIQGSYREAEFMELLDTNEEFKAKMKGMMS